MHRLQQCRECEGAVRGARVLRALRCLIEALGACARDALRRIAKVPGAGDHGVVRGPDVVRGVCVPDARHPLNDGADARAPEAVRRHDDVPSPDVQKALDRLNRALGVPTEPALPRDGTATPLRRLVPPVGDAGPRVPIAPRAN